MNIEPLDPAAIKAEHTPHPGNPWCPSCDDYTFWPCLLYLLADRAEVAEAEAEKWERLTAESVDVGDMYRTDLMAAEAKVANVAWLAEPYMGAPDTYMQYAVHVGDEVYLAVLLDDLRAMLAKDAP